MISKDMHPVRKVFRSSLLVLLGVSIGFLGFVVFLRVSFHDKPIHGPLQSTMFKADILQYRAMTLIGNDKKDMRIAEQLLGLSFFSPLYSQAGLDILNDKHKDGYAPATERLIALGIPPETPSVQSP